MTEQKNGPAKPDEGSEIRSKLAARLAIAGILVAILLGVLAFFDYLAAPPDDNETPEFTKPVPVAPKKQVSQPVTPTENLPEPPAPEKPAAAETPPAETPVPQQPPAVEPPPASRSAPAPAPAQPPAAKPQAAPKPVPEATSAPSNLVPPPAPKPAVEAPRPAPRVAEPAPRVSEAAPAPLPVPPPQPAATLNRLFSGFLVQAGVFTSVQRAEELHAKLTLSGVPSTLETRVQVGPFRTRQEAEAAQAKLRELGIQSVLVPPRAAHR